MIFYYPHDIVSISILPLERRALIDIASGAGIQLSARLSVQF